MRAVVVGLLLLSGCDALFNLDHVPSRDGGGVASDADGATDDAVIDADTQNICMGTGRGFHAKFCYPAGTPFPASFAPTAPIDTDTMCDEVVAQMGTTGICIKKAQRIDIAPSLRVTGGRPLVLLASDRIDIPGTLDASSNRGGQLGGGANTGETTLSCAVLYINGDPGGSSTGGGGGAGGTFRGAGGNGGNGSSTNGGTARPAENPTKIHGGCDGGDGGSGNGLTMGTPGAAGGGAIYLAATNAITVTGSIKVNGAGGLGGAAFYGGSGGGAGGMIVLDAPSVTLGASTSLLAVGGGGGQGGDSVGNGANGTDGPVATGGVQGTSGGAGGAGSDVNATGGGSGTIAGGGGGGGGGYILIASPAPVIVLNGMLRPSPLVQ